MVTGHPPQASASLLRDLHTSGCRPDAIAFRKMVDDLFCGGLWELGLAHAAPTALDACLTTRATA